ncbi:MAG: SUMF1/EgtB/PvdO family nonheme iron enzyme [Chloroflexi bacterium]|nr:SUMF1/EgtB/PvdO family nonheme iron enzyme [Chloroflexota bacterium]
MPEDIKIFINYRRADNAVFVELIRTWFMHRYGRENVFMDFDSIPPFARFEDFIRQKISESDAVVSIIGPQWLDLLQEKAREGKPDYVRIELEEALKHHKVIAPLCIQDGKVPPEEHIPENLRPIFERNVPNLKSGRDIIDNIYRIMDALEQALAVQGIYHRPGSDSEQTDNLKQAAGSSRFNIHEAIGHLFEAEASSDLPAALLWLSQIKESGEAIPSFLNLEQKAATIQQQIKAEEERRRLHEVAEYHYSFVRLMVQYNQPREQIADALREVWAIVDGYDPDQLGDDIFVTAASASSIDLLPPPFDWIDIPAGQVTLEGGHGTFDVPAFTIAKYPVTVAQYEVFMNDGGYTTDRWWTNSGWQWLKNQGYTTPRYWDDDEWQSLWKPDHPVVGISWFEAYAFTQWLSEKMSENIHLPTEQQWQRAAQGNDGRVFPWGNEWDASRCNNDTIYANWGKTKRKAGNTTSPVTVYEGKDNSPFGAVDMSGNVGEWTNSIYETAKSIDLEDIDLPHVVRGSSWFTPFKTSFRVDSRSGKVPDYESFDLGFRVARSLK